MCISEEVYIHRINEGEACGIGKGSIIATSNDHSLPQDSTFPFCYIISNTRERQAKLEHTVKFNENCDKVPTTKDAWLGTMTKLLSLKFGNS